MKPIDPGAILIICVRYLGDTLLLRPCLRALRTAFPGARIDAVVAAGTGCALDDCPDVSRVVEWPARGILHEAAALARLAAGGYDWAVDFTGNDRSALISLASRAAFRVAYERPKLPAWSLRRAAYTLRPPHRKAKPHTLIQRLELLGACGVPPQGQSFGLVPRRVPLDASRARLSGLPEKVLHAHVTSRDMQKAIPADVVREVLSGAIRSGWGVVLTGGRAEIERQHASACTAGLPSEKYRVFHDLDWHGLVGTISLCDAYWGADTAPEHIAAALEKRMLIHFGPSRADHWKPLHPGAIADVRTCACLKTKRMLCQRGIPGKCLHGIRAPDVLEWLEISASKTGTACGHPAARAFCAPSSEDRGSGDPPA
ncbi:MAG: glycosyltransferase family 9 protein [Verrucomicrobiae bacterium]